MRNSPRVPATGRFTGNPETEPRELAEPEVGFEEVRFGTAFAGIGRQ